MSAPWMSQAIALQAKPFGPWTQTGCQQDVAGVCRAVAPRGHRGLGPLADLVAPWGPAVASWAGPRPGRGSRPATADEPNGGLDVQQGTTPPGSAPRCSPTGVSSALTLLLRRSSRLVTPFPTHSASSPVRTPPHTQHMTRQGKTTNDGNTTQHNTTHADTQHTRNTHNTHAHTHNTHRHQHRHHVLQHQH